MNRRSKKHPERQATPAGERPDPSHATSTVKQVARLTGLTVRTLHHWDEIGLVRPRRDPNGYRAYDAEDLARLQEVRVYQELDLDLDRIRTLLADPGRDRSAVLVQQRDALERRVERLMALMGTLEHTLEAERAGVRLSPQQLFEAFGDFDPTAYTDEVDARWGQDDAGAAQVAESRRRTRGYGPDDWRQIKAEAKGLNQDMAAHMGSGAAPTSPEAVALAERMRQHIDRWFYACTPAMHRTLAASYTDDPRFERHYEQVAEGLAAYVRAAIEANPGPATAAS